MDNLPSIVSEARALRVADEIGLRNAANFRAECGDVIKRIEGELDPKISAAHKAHKLLVAEKKARIAPYEQAERIAGDAIVAYNAEQQRKADALAAELTAKAKAQAEEAAIREAIALESAGDSKAGDALLAVPIEPVAAYVVPDVPKIDGLSLRENWTFEIVNAGLIPREYLIPDSQHIGETVRGMKGQTRIPGVRAYSTKSVVQR
jgi:hypothetical protein